MEAYNKAGQQVVWDATSLTAATTCQRKYYYQILRSWSAKKTSIHLIFGKVFASALEDFFRDFTDGDDYEEALVQLIRKVLEWTHNDPVFNGERSKSRLALCRAIVLYLDRYFDHDFYHLFDAAGVKGIEMTFAIEIDSNWVLTGRMDRVLEDANGVQILDQKTAGGPLDRRYFAGYTPNNQVSAYQLAGQIAFPNRVKALLIDAVSIGGGKVQMARSNIARSPSQLEEWVKNTKTLIDNLHRLDPTDPTAFPQNPAACGMFGGCPFREVCSASPEVREILLAEDFEERPWNPVKGVSVNETAA